MPDDKFHLKVQSREGVLYEGDVIALTSFNEKGKFDILALHTNFISLIQKKLEIRDEENTDKAKEIRFNNALLRVKENNVEVYLGVEGLLGKSQT